MSISRWFTLSGEPKSKQRPRFTRSGHVYTPQETRDAEKAIKEAFEEQDGVSFEDSILRMELVFALSNRRPRDTDNMAKLVMDALNKVAYHDDKQVIELLIRRVRSPKGWTLVTISETEEASYDSPEEYRQTVKGCCQSCP